MVEKIKKNYDVKGIFITILLCLFIILLLYGFVWGATH